MRGDLVIVRTFGDIPLIRRLWKEDENTIYITNNEQYQILINGKIGLEPIGFPKKDVFKFSPELAPSIDQLYKTGKLDWNKLVSF